MHYYCGVFYTVMNSSHYNVEYYLEKSLVYTSNVEYNIGKSAGHATNV